MKLIVGLGNPGYLYTRNRHNIGFMCVNQLAKSLHITFDRKQGQARTGIGIIDGDRVVLAKPQTYMNASGESVNALMKRLDARSDGLIIIHDDLDLPTGKIRLRLGGSSGGHKGIESIIARIGSQDFYRVRVGIGRPESDNPAEKARDDAVISYVLSDFTADEKEILEKTIPQVSEAVMCLLAEGITAAMNKFN